MLGGSGSGSLTRCRQRLGEGCIHLKVVEAGGLTSKMAHSCGWQAGAGCRFLTMWISLSRAASVFSQHNRQLPPERGIPEKARKPRLLWFSSRSHDVILADLVDYIGRALFSTGGVWTPEGVNCWGSPWRSAA